MVVVVAEVKKGSRGILMATASHKVITDSKGGEIASAPGSNSYKVTLHCKGCGYREVQTIDTVCVINAPVLSIWNYPTPIPYISVNYSELSFTS